VIYIDTSVLVAFYYPEPLSGKAEKVVRSEVRPAISRLTEVEFFAAISRKFREGNLVAKDARKIMGLFRSHVDAGNYTLLSLDASHFQAARDRIGSLLHPLRTLDALHLALSEASGRELVTSDPPLARTARALRVPVRFIR